VSRNYLSSRTPFALEIQEKARMYLEYGDNVLAIATVVKDQVSEVLCGDFWDLDIAFPNGAVVWIFSGDA